MDLNIIIALITSLWLWWVIWWYVKHLLDSKNDSELRQKQINEERYRTILVYMLVIVDTNNLKHCEIPDTINLFSLKENDLKKHLLHKLTTHYYFSIINTSSKETLVSIKTFIEKPNIDNYIDVAINMKNDLWGKNKKLIIKDLKLK